ncbi:MAG: hypothetical protein AAB496_00245 [Patescibacteria group bacterium]
MKAELIKEKGQSILEVLIALGVLAMSLSAAIYLFFSGQSMLIDSRLNQKALYLARQNMEEARLGAISNFNSLQSSSSMENGFLKELIVEQTAGDTKKIISRVSWNPTPLRNSKKELVTYLTNWRSVSSGAGGAAGGGGSPPTGDWANPRTLTSVDIGPGNEGTDIEVKSSYAYLTSEASDVNKPDLFIFNVSDPSSPILTSQTNFGIKGLNSLNISGNYLYAVSNDDSQEFLIIDISNPALPTKISSVNLSGSSNGITVFYKNNFAYVGRASGAAQEFVIIDVFNRSSPQYYSGLSGVGGEINDIFVFNNRAYLGTEDDNNGLTIVNVGDPANPSKIGSLNVGEHVYGAYLTAESSAFVGGKTKFYITDASNPASVNVIGSIATGGKVNDVVTAGTLAFLATGNSTKEFQVINFATSSNPILNSSFNFPQQATGVDYLNNLIYMSVRSNDALRIITSQ